MATVTITGGTGLIGNALTRELLSHGYDVIVLTRDSKKHIPNNPRLSYALWDVAEGMIDEKAISAADYIVHLAGANVADKRWTQNRKRVIVDSRIKSSELIVQALRTIPNQCKGVISASAIGWYGPDPQIPNTNPFSENAPAAKDFLGNTCTQWEGSIEPVLSLNKRLVILRTGIVLSNEGGAYREFKKPIQFGVAAHMGDGRQMVSWIHIKDIVRMYIYAIENEKMNGIYNGVAPMPVSNKVLVNTIAQQIKKRYIKAHVPAAALKLALGEMSVEVLKSCTVSADKTLQAGFSFFFPSVEAAVYNLK